MEPRATSGVVGHSIQTALCLGIEGDKVSSIGSPARADPPSVDSSPGAEIVWPASSPDTSADASAHGVADTNEDEDADDDDDVVGGSKRANPNTIDTSGEGSIIDADASALSAGDTSDENKDYFVATGGEVDAVIINDNVITLQPRAEDHRYTIGRAGWARWYTTKIPRPGDHFYRKPAEWLYNTVVEMKLPLRDVLAFWESVNMMVHNETTAWMEEKMATADSTDERLLRQFVIDILDINPRSSARYRSPNLATTYSVLITTRYDLRDWYTNVQMHYIGNGSLATLLPRIDEINRIIGHWHDRTYHPINLTKKAIVWPRQNPGIVVEPKLSVPIGNMIPDTPTTGSTIIPRFAPIAKHHTEWARPALCLFKFHSLKPIAIVWSHPDDPNTEIASQIVELKHGYTTDGGPAIPKLGGLVGSALKPPKTAIAKYPKEGDEPAYTLCVMTILHLWSGEVVNQPEIKHRATVRNINKQVVITDGGLYTVDPKAVNHDYLPSKYTPLIIKLTK